MNVAVVQARMGSERLPGKAVRRLGHRPVLAWVVRAARQSECDDVIVATTRRPEDDVLADLARDLGVRQYRGDDEDVLSRFVEATADLADDDLVVRLTGDNPLTDPQVLDGVLATCTADGGDYASSASIPSLPLGVGSEVIRARALRRTAQVARDFHRVHVTSYVRAHPEQFAICGPAGGRPSPFRVTLDTPQDADALDAIVDVLGDRVIPWQEVVALLHARPDIVALNSGIQQKQAREG